MRAPPATHIGFLHRLVGRHLLERPFSQVSALGHDDDVVAKPRDDVHVVLDQEQRDAVGDEGLEMSPISRASVGLTPAIGSSSRMSLRLRH